MKLIYKIANFISGLIGIRADYIQHFGVCFLLSLLGTHGAACAVGASLAAEYKDSTREDNKWCWWDLLAGALGIIFGLLTHYTILT